MTTPESNPSGDNTQSHKKAGGARRPKRWYERTSVTLCVAAALGVVGLGFIHVILGVTNPYGLPFDVVLRESFGYREMVVDVRKIMSLPYAAAKHKYPLSIEALQRSGYLPDHPGFEARMMAHQQESVGQWQREFEAALGRPPTCWLDRLQGTGQAPEDSEDAGACNQRGIASARQGEYQTALAEFSRAIRRNPTFVEAFYNRALVSIEIGNVGQAASDLGAVAEIRPGFVEGHVQRGRLYLAMNEHDKAVAEFTKAAEIDPRCAEALFHRSLAHYTRGDYAKALEDVRAIQSLGMTVPAGFIHALRGGSESSRIRVSSPFED
jgi:tetratricopeptide (TPR) repeat protein